jgi:hypothetical protein
MKRQPSKVGVTFFFMLACNILTMVIRGDKHTTNTLISNHRSRWLLHQSVGRFYSRNGQQRATLLSTRSHGDVHEQNKSKHTHTHELLFSLLFHVLICDVVLSCWISTTLLLGMHRGG